MQSLYDRLSSEQLKALLCLQASLKIPKLGDDARRKWIARGTNQLAVNYNELPTFFTSNLAYILRDDLPKLGSLDAHATRQIAFVCLEEISEFRDGQFFYLPDRVGSVAEVLAGIDPQLSLTLLKPFVEDFSWLFRNGYRWSVTPLTNVARVDPNLAVAIAEQLIDGPLRDDKARAATILRAVTDGLSVPE